MDDALELICHYSLLQCVLMFSLYLLLLIESQGIHGLNKCKLQYKRYNVQNNDAAYNVDDAFQ